MARDLYKYEVVAHSLRERILGGDFPERQLPLVENLAAEFGVSAMPVSQALNRLADEGLVERVKGQGTFIAGSRRQVAVARQVAVLMGQGGHFYGPMREVIYAELLSRGYFALGMDVATGKDSPVDPAHLRAGMEQLVASPLRGVIYSGVAYWRWPFLRGREQLPNVAVAGWVGAGDPPGAAVVADYRAGAAMAVAHLAGLGHQRIAFITVREHPELLDPEALAHSVLMTGERGYRQGMTKAGLEAFSRVHYRPHGLPEDSPVPSRLCRDWLRAPERPTALICSSDLIAADAMQAAHQLGMRLPDDLAVVGMHNTPWSRHGLVPITSVSFREEEIGRRAVSRLLAPSPDHSIETIAPKLIVRRSCGATAHAEPGEQS